MGVRVAIWFLAVCGCAARPVLVAPAPVEHPCARTAPCGLLLEHIPTVDFRFDFVQAHCQSARRRNGLHHVIEDYAHAELEPTAESPWRMGTASKSNGLDRSGCQAWFARSIDAWLTVRYPAADWASIDAACAAVRCDRTVGYEERVRASDAQRWGAWVAEGRVRPTRAPDSSCRGYPDLFDGTRLLETCSAWWAPAAPVEREPTKGERHRSDGDAVPL